VTQLVIAEKSKMAKKIATALGVPPVPSERGLYANETYRIVSCEGHILEDFMPDDYSDDFKKWSLETLPINPEQWKLKISESKKRYVIRIQKELAKANEIIHLGDPDDEGQAIVDDVLKFLGWNGPTQRALVNDLNPEPIRQAFQRLEDNEAPKFRGMYRKALSRRHGDWVLGLNLTRLYTILGRKLNLNTTLSAGRVQSAVLGLIVRRHLEISNFKSHNYYEIEGLAKAENGAFKVQWKPVKTQEGLDPKGRLIDSSIAQRVVSKSPLKCKVAEYDTQRKQQSAPITFSMSELQKECSNRLGLTMQEVLDIAQKLYEQYNLITYPRSDNGYLPDNHHNEAPKILNAIQHNIGLPAIQRTDTSLKSAAFSDKKTASSAHHGIIPTANASSSSIASLTSNEKAVYQIISERYAAQFLPPAVFLQTSVLLVSACGEQFVTNGRLYESMGWRELKSPPSDDENEGDEDEDSSEIPFLEVGEIVQVCDIQAPTKQTKPPRPYTDATLLKAMVGIDKHVQNKKIAQLLKAGKGIGTDATRGSIIEKLVQHKLIVRKSKNINPTDVGITHYQLMPPEITAPDMAALFELKTQEVQQGSITKEQFLTMLDGFVRAQIQGADKWVANAQRLGVQPPQTKSEKSCRHCQGGLKSVKSAATQTKLYLCQGCDSIYANDGGNAGICIKGPLKESDLKARQERLQERLKDAPPCPVCKAPILKTASGKGKKPFWGCRSCNSAFADFGGQIGPVFMLRGERIQAPADGPACPDCTQPMHRRTTSKKKPIFVCETCDSMCWTHKGGVGKWFKYRGEMISSFENPEAHTANK